MFSTKRIIFALVMLAVIFFAASCVPAQSLRAREQAQEPEPVKMTWKASELGASTILPGNPRFQVEVSPDGRRYAGTCETSDTESAYTVIIDGAAGKTFATTTRVTFSPDSKRTVCLAISPGASSRILYHVLIDGVESEERAYPWGSRADAYQPVFSPDSKHVAYCAFSQTKWDNDERWQLAILVVDTTDVDTGMRPWCASIFDSPARFHYIGTKGGKVFLVEVEIGG